jgi:hypothetical protein
MQNDIPKSVLKEVTGAAIQDAFVALATVAGFPTAVLAAPFAKGLVLGLVENCFNDCAQMTLSKNEKKKLNRCFEVALQTFREQAEQDGVVAWELNIDPSYFDYAYEVAEHATLESIRQSEKKKIDVIGRYYGKQFYKGNTNWQDMHQVITMAGNLTFRQIVMIRLINEGFKDLDGKMFISNEAACVEVNRLLDYGIWQTEGTTFGTNDSWMIQLDSLIPTYYTEKVCDALMLEKLSDDDIQIVIETLHLTAEGSPQTMLTEDDYKAQTTWHVEGEKLILPDGKTFGGDPDEDMFLFDKIRGK